jgi:hypothetical protein
MEKEFDWPIENQHYYWLKVVKRSRKKKYSEKVSLLFLFRKLIIAV